MERAGYLVKNNMHPNLSLFQELIRVSTKLQLSMLKAEEDNADYGGYSFYLNTSFIQFRTAKVTPKKIGQFVTFYKRLPSKIIAPFDIEDHIDFYIIGNSNADAKGFFILPKEALLKHDIVSQNNIGGKRGFRLYLPNDLTLNKQSKLTQEWQAKYYLDLNLSHQEWQYGDLAFTW